MLTITAKEKTEKYQHSFLGGALDLVASKVPYLVHTESLGLEI